MNENRRHPALIALIAVVGLEALGLTAATVFLAVELVVATPESMPTAIALAVTTAVIAAGLIWMLVGLIQGKRTVRGGILVWQVLQAAIGVGALQGIFARPDIGWALLIPAIVGFVLLLTPPVTAALGREPDSDAS